MIEIYEWFERVTKFPNDDYGTAMVGVSVDGKAVYDYHRMVEYLMEKDRFTEEEAVEWITYNTIRSLPYLGDKAPIIMYALESEEWI